MVEESEQHLAVTTGASQNPGTERFLTDGLSLSPNVLSGSDLDRLWHSVAVATFDDAISNMGRSVIASSIPSPCLTAILKAHAKLE
ncbi:hypothetical protein MY3296_008076 [Beauveria thailandica]